MSSDGICVIDNRISSHFESNSRISSFRSTTVNKSAQLSTESLAPSDPEVLVDQVSDLSSSEEAVFFFFFLSFSFLQTDFFLEAGILDDSVQC